MRTKRRTWLAICLLVALLAVGAGCLGGGNSGATPTPDGFTLDGVVEDARTGEAVSDVTVAVDNRTVETDSDGSFEIEELPSGTYRVTAEKPGYYSQEMTISLSTDRNVTVAIKQEGFYQPDQSSLVATHWENDLTCESCHRNPQGEIQEPPADSTCRDCHPMETIRNETAAFDPNPHDDPHDRARDCGSCHKVHEPSVDACSNCHSDSMVPDPP